MAALGRVRAQGPRRYMGRGERPGDGGQHLGGLRCPTMCRIPSVNGMGMGGEAAIGMSGAARALPWAGDEGELVTELQGGSEEAFEYLVTYYHSTVYNLMYGMLGNPGNAADATQEAFLKVFRGIRGFRRGSSLKTWLYRIAVREALNQRRWFWRHTRNQVSMDRENEDHEPVMQIEDENAKLFEECSSREMQGIVREALAHVAAPFRSAVILRDLEGLSYEEVAEVLEVSVGTVKSRILRGRRALREILEPVLRASATAEAAKHTLQVPQASHRPAPKRVPELTMRRVAGGMR
jgi:RNA polymerase sigma-70 factor, ECF subfamily